MGFDTSITEGYTLGNSPVYFPQGLSTTDLDTGDIVNASLSNGPQSLYTVQDVIPDGDSFKRIYLQNQDTGQTNTVIVRTPPSSSPASSDGTDNSDSTSCYFKGKR